jgi:hypothetical protein
MTKGKKPSSKSLALQKAGIELFVKSPASLENAAKTLIALELSLLTAYISLFTFFKINTNSVILYINLYISAVLVIWFISMFSSALAFIPSEKSFDLNCITEIEKTIYAISKRKRKYLSIGFVFFIAFNMGSFCILWFGSESP